MVRPSMRPFFAALLVLSLSACPGPEDGDDLVCPKSPQSVTLAATLQMQVFDADCKTCHNPSNSNGDYSTAEKTYAATVGVSSQFANGGTLKVVDPGSLKNSILWLKVLGGDSFGRKGPNGESTYGAMPLGNGLSAAKKAALKNWICSGAN